MYGLIARLMRVVGVDLNWLFDPVGAVILRVQRAGESEHLGEVGQNPHEE